MREQWVTSIISLEPTTNKLWVVSPHHWNVCGKINAGLLSQDIVASPGLIIEEPHCSQIGC